MCSPACQKLLLNSGFMAPLARHLASYSQDQSIRSVAKALADAAELHNAVAAAAKASGVLRIDAPRGEFEGCEQATALLSWVLRARKSTAHLDEDIEQMRDWTEALYDNIHTIVSGAK
mgnify:FL=1